MELKHNNLETNARHTDPYISRVRYTRFFVYIGPALSGIFSVILW